MATVTAKTSSPRIRVNTGTSASGAATTKTVSLFSTSLTKPGAYTDTNAQAAVLALASLYEALCLYTLNAVEIAGVETLTD